MVSEEKTETEVQKSGLSCQSVIAEPKELDILELLEHKGTEWTIVVFMEAKPISSP